MRFITPIFLLLLCVSLAAQEDLPLETTYTIPSAAFGDDRKITVYLPPNYYERPDEAYTITYVLDGHYDPFIDLVVKTIEYNTNNRKYLPTIVVGIHAKARGWEFYAPMPGNEDDESYEGGRAPELQKHLAEEVIPFVEKRFPKTLDYKTLIGHSAGGAFVLYSLFSDHPDVFDSYIAISPGLRPGEDLVLEEIAKRLQSGATYRKFLYASAGDVGEREDLFGAAVLRLDSMLSAHPDHGLLWHPQIFPGEDHFTVVPMTVNAGMLALARDFRVDDAVFAELANQDETSMIDWVDNFYAQRKADYGFQAVLSAGSLSRVSRYLRDKGQTAAALDVCAWGLKHYPDDYWLTYNTGDIHQRRGEPSLALIEYEKCQAILEKIKSSISENRYKGRSEHLLKMMAEVKE